MDTPAQCLVHCRRAFTDPQYQVAINAIEAAISDAFELGVKSAGGAVVPDRSKFVELALDRDQIDALAQAAEDAIGDGTFTHTEDEALKRFLETVSIFRRK